MFNLRCIFLIWPQMKLIFHVSFCCAKGNLALQPRPECKCQSVRRITAQKARVLLQLPSVPLTFAFSTPLNVYCRLPELAVRAVKNRQTMLLFAALHLCPPNWALYLRWPSPFLDHISIFMSCTISSSTTTKTTFPQCTLCAEIRCLNLLALSAHNLPAIY